MEIKKIPLILILGLSTITIKAENNFIFPMNDTFSVKKSQGKVINKYNKLILVGNHCQILKSDFVLKYYKITEFA